MAGLDRLTALIYHEKQQPGSMLCAQHALNNLLQGPDFTAPDLSDIGRSLDLLEQQYDQGISARTSANMDDTGFFSIQVLDKALGVWGLHLVRWRSEAMRPYQDSPDTQLAFILNYELHWYTLRRFGVDTDNTTGHWFNLNSSLKSPKWVSKLYLGMVLQQAEADGYSVFVVRQVDPSNPLELPRTEADVLASTLPEPPSSTQSNTTPDTDTINNDDSFNDDDDYDLQAVLQASLMAGLSHDDDISSSSSNHHPTLQTPFIPPMPASDLESAPGSSSRPIRVSDSPSPPRHRHRHRYGAPGDPPADEEDLVAASVKRNRIIMERMLREQEMAQREVLQDELARYDHRRSRRRQQEDQMLRRAIQESKASANIEDADEDDQEDMDLDDDELIDQNHVRVYDDDDEELQRALKASLETVPQGFTVNLPPQPPPVQPPPINAQTIAPIAVDEEEETESMDTQSETEGDDATNSSLGQQDAEPVSMDELRRKRLARFGG